MAANLVDFPETVTPTAADADCRGRRTRASLQPAARQVS